MSVPGAAGEHELTNSASLRVSVGPLTAPVLTRVVSMVLARANCPVDRLEDALVICDTLAAHAPAHASDGRLTFRVATANGGAELRVSALSPGGARALLGDAALPGVGNVLEHVVDEVRFEQAAEGHGEDLVLIFGFKPAAG